ncbi:MAG: hypothetical protein V3U31_01650 [Dehalococcoidia bacterium]
MAMEAPKMGALKAGIYREVVFHAPVRHSCVCFYLCAGVPRVLRDWREAAD